MSSPNTFRKSLRSWFRPHSSKNSVDGCADKSPIDDWEYIPPAKPDDTPTPLGDDPSLAPPDSDATTIQVPDISQVPRVSAVGRLYSKDTFIRRSRKGTDRITDISVRKDDYIPVSVEMVPFDNGEEGYDPDASYLTVHGDDGPQRRTFMELGNYEIGQSAVDPTNLRMGIGPHMSYSDWEPDKVVVCGKYETHHNPDDDGYVGPDVLPYDEPFIKIRKYQLGYYSVDKKN